jgi:hypothetical protein
MCITNNTGLGYVKYPTLAEAPISYFDKTGFVLTNSQ